MVVLFFSACKKDLLTPSRFDDADTTISDPTTAFKEKEIPIDEAKQWFEQVRDSLKSLSGFSPLSDTLLFHNPSTDWDRAINDRSNIGQAFVLIPVENNFGGKGDSKLLIYRNSTGAYSGVIMAYFPHATQNQNRLSPLSFKGFVVYTDLAGRYLGGYDINNGVAFTNTHVRVVRNGTSGFDIFEPTSGNGACPSGSSVVWTSYDEPCPPIALNACTQQVFVWSCRVGTNSPGGSLINLGNVGFGPSAIGGGYGGSGGTGSSGGNNGGNTSGTWGSSQPNIVFIDLNEKVRQIERWGLRNFMEILTSEDELFNGIFSFLGRDGTSPVVTNLINANSNNPASFAALGQYIRLFVNNDFFTASQNVGFSNFVDFKKYTGNGFTPIEFGTLFLGTEAFELANVFLNNHNFDSKAVEIIKESVNNPTEIPGYGGLHAVSLNMKAFNFRIWSAFEGANNYSTIKFHEHCRGLGGSDGYSKSIGAIGEGIFVSRLSNESGSFSLIAQNSRIGGYQHDAVLYVPLVTIGGTGTHDLVVNYTDEDGIPTTYRQNISTSGSINFAKVSYEVKTNSASTDASFLINAFEEGVQQIVDRTTAIGINAGILVFDIAAFDVIKNTPRVITALSRLKNLRNSNGQKNGFLRLEPNLRQETENAYYALKDRIKNIAP